jgi:hypothetical protein
MPSSPAPRLSSFRLRRVTATSRSPFTGRQQTYEHPFALWEAEITLPAMKRAKAGEWQAFFLQCHGTAGTFWLGDPDAKTARGGATGGVVNGNGQTGYTISVRNLGANKGALPGDYLQIGERLYMVVLANAGSAGGTATFTIEPQLKVSPADGAAVIFTNPRGLFRMQAPDLGWDADHASVYGFSFSAIEAW